MIRMLQMGCPAPMLMLGIMAWVVRIMVYKKNCTLFERVIESIIVFGIGVGITILVVHLDDLTYFLWEVLDNINIASKSLGDLY